MWLNLLIAVVWFTCLIENTSVSGTEAENSDPTKKVCTSETCETVATRIKSYMNEAVNPCDDFYKFACGGGIERGDVSENKGERRKKELFNRVKGLLESKVTTPDPRINRLVANMRKHYRNCINFDAVVDANNIVKRFLSAVPLPHINSGWRNMELERFIAELQTLGLHYPIAAYAAWDWYRAPDFSILRFRYLSIFVPPKGNENGLLQDSATKYRLTRKSIITQVLKQVYKDFNIVNVTVDVDAILNLEILIANTSAREWYYMYSPRWSLSQIKNRSTESFNWTRYLDHVMAHQDPPRPFPDDMRVFARVKYYCPVLEDLFANNDKKLTFGLLATFLLLEKYKGDLPKTYRDIFQVKKKVRDENMIASQRLKRCLDKIRNERFSEVIIRIYSQEYFDQTAKKSAKEMASYMKSEFQKRFKNNEWIDESGRDFAFERVQNMTEAIGYPDRIYDTNYMERKYGWKNVSDKGYLYDEIQIIKEDRAREIRSIFVGSEKKWYMEPLSAKDGKFIDIKRKLIVPMGHFLPPYYLEGYPNYLNYGGIGASVGYQLIGGFLTIIWNSGDWGTMNNYIPLSERNQAAYRKAYRCVIDQYDAISAPFDKNITLNGLYTATTNIADNLGIIEAFEGYRQWVKKNGKPELKLPGLDYTPEQLLFINFGQAKCVMPDKKSWTMKTSYPPNSVRVNGALSKSPEFHKTFQCGPEAKMNFEKKCAVW